MGKENRLLSFLALVLIAALMFSSLPAEAGGSADRVVSLAASRDALQQELWSLVGSGFVGIAHSEEEGEVIVFVEDEHAKQKAPSSFEGYPVRAEVTGRLEAFSTQAAPVVELSAYRQDEVRPLVGGTSLSAWITRGPWPVLYAGTLGMVTYDNKVLSNAHVIAMESDTQAFIDIGTPIIQPGSRDGGRLADRVGELEAYIPIDFGPDAQNYADAAIGSIDTGVSGSAGEQFDERGNYWIEGWTEVSRGDYVRKSGRSTGVTTGKVVHTNASVWINYGDESAYFVDQIVVEQEDWSFGKQGDSGAAVDKDGRFVGLVFGGSETRAVICKAEYIIDGLGIAVEVPEGRSSLDISSTSGGLVAEPGEGRFIYDDGTAVGLVAEPEQDFQFVRWGGDVDTVGDVYAKQTTITMDGSYSITAEFELRDGLSRLALSSAPGGQVTVPGQGTFVYETGTTIDLVAEADDDYRFAQWTGEVDTIGDVYAVATNITMDDSYSVTADFELLEDRSSLNISSTSGGTVTTPGEGVSIHDTGTTVDLVAEPEEDFRFVKWTGDVETITDVHAAETTIAMHDSYSITANFESWQPAPQVQLTISSTDGGSVADPGERSFAFPLGTQVNLVAVSEEGYRFVGWSSDADTIADTTAASTTIVMESSYSVRADFERIPARCFIATAAYGTPMVEEVQILRDFRDGYLITNPPGQAFVCLYYRISPPVAEFITDHPGLRPIVRAALVPAVIMSGAVVNTYPSQKAASAGLLALLSVVVMASVTGSRGRDSESTSV